MFPVEFKHGRKREKIQDDIQLAAQAVCLEEMLSVTVPLGAIYHASSLRRREVVITPELRGAVEAPVNAVKQMIANGVPPPANNEHCRACSLIDACQAAAFADVTRAELMEWLNSRPRVELNGLDAVQRRRIYRDTKGKVSS